MLIYRSISKKVANLSELSITADVKEVEFDEMRHFIRPKNGSPKGWIVG
ncbi:MAG: hypothetical protein P0S93_02560 [Candidatus Neptunochlamydia sp.]|nr:hypothetical protein [Candidatus Neptunochlamydia sp.]